ncbi:MAG TPA: murein biosynthesis integral membrane protein MurJ [Actinomycetota bacterium]|nr:murein biosynthesis integral membrane protein MurJ [Actinomycetota bacterium]
MSDSRSIETTGRGAAIATAGTAISRATGLLRLGATTYALGVTESRLADTYNLANTTPNMIHELIIGGVLSSVLLRSYIEVKAKEGQEEAWRFIDRVTKATMLLLAAVGLLIVVAAPAIFRLYTIGVEGGGRQSQQALGTLLLQLFVPQILFYGLSYISTAALNAHRRFGIPMFVPALNNLVVTGTLVWFANAIPTALRTPDAIPTQGILILGLGTTAGVAIQGILPFFFLRRMGFGFRRGVGIIDPRFGRLLKLSSFMVGYVATNMVGLWVALILAGRVTGGVASYQYAFVFFQLPHGLLAVSIVTAIFPAMTERAVAGNLSGFARELGRALRGVAYFVFPAVAGYLAIAPQVVALLLEHGLTTTASTTMVATVLRVWAPGIFFFSTFYVFLRGFYALGDTKTPMLINIVGLAVNVSVNLLAVAFIGEPRWLIAGLAAGHGISYLVASALCLRSLTARIGRSPAEGFGAPLMKMLAASSITGAGAYLAANGLQNVVDASSVPGLLAQVAGATVVGVLLYAGASKALSLEEMRWISTIVKRRR